MYAPFKMRFIVFFFKLSLVPLKEDLFITRFFSSVSCKMRHVKKRTFISENRDYSEVKKKGVLGLY